MLQHSVDAAVKSGCFTQIIVSSDDKEILKCASDCGAFALPRPANLAEDSTGMDPVLLHVIETLNLKSDDAFCLLQPTSPLRTAQHIQEAFELFKRNSDADAVFALKKSDVVIQKSVKINSAGFTESLFESSSPFMRRQDFPETFFYNGAIYFVRVGAFCKGNSLSCLKVFPYLMSQEDSIDIDTHGDLMKAERILRSKSV